MKTDVKLNDYKQRIALKIFMAILTVAVVTISVVMLVTKTRLYSNYNSKMNDYLFVFGTSAIFFVNMFLPTVVEKVFRIRISPIISFVFILHCFGGTFLGNVANMYYIIPDFDKYMHFLVGLNLSMMGLAGAQHFNHNKDGKISPLLTATIVLFAGIALSTLWEVFEFTADVLFDMNMQGYALKTGELLVGQDALMNTMIDILANIAGALVIAIPTYFSFKHNKDWHLLCQVNKKPKAFKAVSLSDD